MKLLSPMKARGFNYLLKNELLTRPSDRLLLNFVTHRSIGPSKSECKQLRSQKHYLKLEKSFSTYIEESRSVTKSQKREEKYYGA